MPRRGTLWVEKAAASAAFRSLKLRTALMSSLGFFPISGFGRVAICASEKTRHSYNTPSGDTGQLTRTGKKKWSLADFAMEHKSGDGTLFRAKANSGGCKSQSIRALTGLAGLCEESSDEMTLRSEHRPGVIRRTRVAMLWACFNNREPDSTWESS